MSAISGLGFAGKLPDPSAVQWVDSSEFEPLVRTAEHKDLVSFWDDGGYYPRLSAAAGVDPYDRDEASDKWPLVVIAEPDLVNNYGLADKDRALLALSIVETSLEGAHMPVAFDLTFNGLGQNVAKYCTKGQLVTVEGRIHYTQWEDQSGTKRYGCEIIADKVDFLTKGRSGSNEGAPDIDED